MVSRRNFQVVTLNYTVLLKTQGKMQGKLRRYDGKNNKKREHEKPKNGNGFLISKV